MVRRRNADTVVATATGGEEHGHNRSVAAEGMGSSQRQGGPTAEQIAQRAYDIYRARGGSDGQDMDDWLRAERELREERERFEDRERRESGGGGS